MKKALKIFGITLGALVLTILLTAVIIVWCIFTPERLTPIVRQAADKYITCDHQLNNVELTFFSTFPEFGLKINGLTLINPMEGAQSDTVLNAPSVVATLNVMAYLDQNNLVIRQLSLNDLCANIYINPQGQSNLDIFAIDTTTTDTTAFTLPFDSIVVDGCALTAQRLTFVDEKDSINAALNHTELDLKMTYWDDIHLQTKLSLEHLALKGEEYAHNANIQLNAPAEFDLETMFLKLKEAEVQVNELTLDIDGEITLGDSIPMDITLAAQQWPIHTILDLIPNQYTASLKDISVDGLLSFQASAKGVYADSIMPLIDAQVQLQQGQGAYASLPYTLTDIDLDALLHLDMNTPSNTDLTLNQLTFATKNSTLGIHGTVKDLLGQMQTQAHIDVNTLLTDWTYFLPKTFLAQGRAQGSMDIQANLAQVLNEQVNTVNAKADLQLSHFHFAMDSLQAQLPQATVTMDADLKDWPLISAHLQLQSNDQLSVTADSLDAQLTAPQLAASAAIDTKDTSLIPTFDATLQWKQLTGYFRTYQGNIGQSHIDAKMTSSKHRQSTPVFSATLSSHHIDALAGKNHITTTNLNLDAKAIYRKNNENFLLKWNPIMRFYLNEAEVDLENFDHHVSIPQIIFSYSNREFDILSSSVILGNSDFALSGQIYHIGKWLMKKDVLSGELNFTSKHTDVDELMDIFSADAGSEETITTTTTGTSSEPFLVPLDVDLTLNTHIKEARIMDQVARNLGGKVYVKDGTLVLEEMGFVCDAAKLQLTAMYRTPRRNHIYLGLDYHMLDVKIDQLISMIPQIDTMMPMLRSFKGEAEFHLAGETYLREDYSIKTSTLRGACSLFGKDLVVMDGETFDKISKILSFKKKTENKVDSISAEITLNKDEITIYPFCVSMDNYMVALGGKHNLNKSFDYHINLLAPIYLGVDVTGTFDNLSIKPAKCVYAKDFKPIFRNQVDTKNAELRQTIRESLRKNVKIQ